MQKPLVTPAEGDVLGGGDLYSALAAVRLATILKALPCSLSIKRMVRALGMRA